jgi:hypothetical protein
MLGESQFVRKLAVVNYSMLTVPPPPHTAGTGRPLLSFQSYPAPEISDLFCHQISQPGNTSAVVPDSPSGYYRALVDGGSRPAALPGGCGSSFHLL